MYDGKCHDIKTERREISQGLPASYQLVPIGFYASLVLCSLLSVWFYLGLKSANSRAEKATNEEAQYTAQAAQVTRERTEIESLNKRAQSSAEWVQGAHGLQPLAVALSRSVGKLSTVAELQLTRREELPAHIHLNLKLDDLTPQVRENMQDSIRDLKFRAHNPDENWPGDTSLDYNVTLVWRGDQ